MVVIAMSSLPRAAVCPSFSVGLHNALSVAKKSAAISTWITDCKLNIVGLVETWHDGVDSPQLIACASEGYHYVEKARPRPQSESLSLIDAVNHGGVCLLFDQHLRAR